MQTVNIHEAKTNLSKLVEQAARGEPFVIAKAGKPMVKVVPIETDGASPLRRMGMLKGVIPPPPEDFDTFMQNEIIAMFEGSEIWPSETDDAER